MSTENNEKRYEKCIKNLEQSRKIKKLEDIIQSATMLVSGIVLVISFKRFILEKSKS